MSVEKVVDEGWGGPLRVTFRVSAIGSTDAADQAKVEARQAGWRTKTLGRVELVGPDDNLARTTRRTWLITLVAWPPKVPA